MEARQGRRRKGLRWRSSGVRKGDIASARAVILNSQCLLYASYTYTWIYIGIERIYGSDLQRWQIRGNDVPPWSGSFRIRFQVRYFPELGCLLSVCRCGIPVSMELRRPGSTSCGCLDSLRGRVLSLLDAEPHS